MTIRNILYIWDADYPWDIRVNKITRSLFRNEYNVSVVCRNLERKARSEIINGVSFYRLPAFKSRRINQALSFPFFLNFLWLARIYFAAKRERSQVLIVRDLPMAISAVIIGKLTKIPVVIDMAENYPAMIKDAQNYGSSKFGAFLIRNVTLCNLVERYSLRRIQKFIVVAEENKTRLIQNGVLESDIYLVRNTPDLSEYSMPLKETINEREKALFRNRFTLIYIGGLGPIRGLEMAIEALSNIIRHIPQAHLLVIGKGEKKPILERLAKQHNVINNVTFKGWIDFQDLPQYLACSKVGIIPHLSTDHTNTTIPNKLFDYMAFELPVIASDTAPMKRIIEQEKCGVVFEAGNPESYVSAVLRVFNDHKKSFGMNGTQSVARTYNWKKDEVVLLKVIHDLEKSLDSSNIIKSY
jgi:glycosyltransferase involved in cell wall biosynthesis